MALPDGIITCTVQAGAAVTHTGVGIRLTLTIRPVFIDSAGTVHPARLTHVASGTVLSAITETLVVQDGQPRTFELPVVDQDGFTGPDGHEVKGWAYLVEVVESHIEPWEGTLGLAPGVGRRVFQAPVTIPLQPGLANVAGGIDLDLRPTTAPFVPTLGPSWAGRADEAPEWAQIVYDEITDPTEGRLYVRSVTA